MARVDDQYLQKNGRLSTKQVMQELAIGKNRVKKWRDEGKLKDWAVIDGVFAYCKEEVLKIKKQRLKA